MGELLNIDLLIPEQKYITFGGRKHDVAAASVETWLRIMTSRQKIIDVTKDIETAGEKEENAARMIDLSMDVILLACPTMEKEELKKLPIAVLQKLAEVVVEEVQGSQLVRRLSGGGESTAEGEAQAEGEAGAGEEQEVT